MAAVQRTGESVHAHGDAEARGTRVGRHDGGLGAPGDDPVPAPRESVSRSARGKGRGRLRVGAVRRAGSPRAAVRRDPRLGRGLHEERHEHARRAPRQSARQVVHADVHLERVRRVAARVADHARRRGSGRHVRRCAPRRGFHRVAAHGLARGVAQRRAPHRAEGKRRVSGDRVPGPESTPAGGARGGN